MHHAYCVIALLKELSEASIYLRTPCHILFLLRYIHESFLRFWLNANNSECFCLPTMLLEIIGGSYWLTGMKSASKVQRLLEKRKLFGKIFSFPTDFSVFPWLIYKKQDVCGKIIVWIGTVSICRIPQWLPFVLWLPVWQMARRTTLGQSTTKTRPHLHNLYTLCSVLFIFNIR